MTWDKCYRKKGDKALEGSVAAFKILVQHPPRETEKNYEKSLSGQPVHPEYKCKA